jgi:hypothetical protein
MANNNNIELIEHSWLSNCSNNPNIKEGDYKQTTITTDDTGAVFHYDVRSSSRKSHSFNVEGLWSFFIDDYGSTSVGGSTAREIIETMNPTYVKFSAASYDMDDGRHTSSSICVYNENKDLIYGRIAINDNTVARYIMGRDKTNALWPTMGTKFNPDMVFQTITPDYVPSGHEGCCNNHDHQM